MNEFLGEPLAELESFLRAMEDAAPQRGSGDLVHYRTVLPGELIDDSLKSDPQLEDDEGDRNDNDPSSNVESFIPAGSSISTTNSKPDGEFDFTQAEMRGFSSSPTGPVTAVDCGIVRLGETENGLVIALRAAAIRRVGDQISIHRFRTGPIYLRNVDKPAVLHRMGSQLGRPDFFVEMESQSSSPPTIIRVKPGVADDSHQYGDRFRNWLERLVQMIAVSSTDSGIVLFDGALTLRTRDTPKSYLEKLANVAHEHGNSIIAISKQSLLAIQGRPIRFWLNDAPNQACYRLLTPLMRREGTERVLGNAYAVRFTPLGPTFRMDVKALPGLAEHEVVNQLRSSMLFRGGYPEILVQAHIHSYFTTPHVIQLQAHAGAKFRFRAVSEPDLGGIFGLFGGRYK